MENSKKRAALHNLGCKVNAYETEAMRQLLEEAGYTIVPFTEQADVYVINTCTVTNIADRKSRQMIHRAKKLNPEAIVVAAGCYVQTSEAQAEADPAIDILIGNNRKGELISLLESFGRDHGTGRSPGSCGGARQAAESDTGTAADGAGESVQKSRQAVIDINCGAQPYENLTVSHPAEHTRAFLKVQDGCNQFCSYCIIPYARGRVRSRRPEDIVAETRGLAENGFQEIVLTGIHLSSYGVDMGVTLLDLIRRLHEVEEIRRIRLGSLEPNIITEEFVAELSGLKKVCPHFHLSLQSGSDTVLRRMNRKYTAEEYLHKCEILRKYYEHPALCTDVIVGFPGETEEEFAETCAFVRRAAFYEIHVFKYSKRDGTAAARMEGQLTERVKSDRSRRLMEIGAELKRSFAGWYEGKPVEVLFEEPVTENGEQFYEGFTPEYVKIRYRTDESVGNRIMKVEFFRLIV